MAQLALFEGSHVPRIAAREALLRGEIVEAQAQLAHLPETTAEGADATRLERITSSLRTGGEDLVRSVHDAFVSVLEETRTVGFLSEREWFQLYALRLASALDAEPGRRFRGWLGAHFAFAAGRTEAARRAAERIVECEPPGVAWVEAARLAFELGDDPKAREWIHGACLDGRDELSPVPPRLEPCDVGALDAAPPLPALPASVEDLFDEARNLEGLPGPSTRWVAVLGEIDRVLGPPNAHDAGPPEHPADDGDAARAFLAALRAARRSRERDRARAPGSCSDRELRARKRMQRLSPELLARYVRRLDGSLF